MSRASTSGVHTAALLRAVATDVRGRRRAVATEAARRAGVRAVLPLGACFLPAFVLLGIVPTIAGLASSALGSG
jgi:pilus assembly protein TadC